MIDITYLNLNWPFCLVTISCDIALTPKQTMETYKLRHVPRNKGLLKYAHIYIPQRLWGIAKYQKRPFYEALYLNWNMESTKYSQCSNPLRSFSTRKRRSIDEDREVIKLRTTQTIAEPKQKSSSNTNALSVFILLTLSYWTQIIPLLVQNRSHVRHIRLYLQISLYIHIYWQILKLITLTIFNLGGCTSKKLMLFFLSQYC